jgi:hypothetical protein
MSMIFIRDANASTLSDEVLKSLKANYDGWSITYFKDEVVKSVFSDNMDKFIETYQIIEAYNCRMMVNLADYLTGDESIQNLLPIRIEGVGYFVADGYIANQPKQIEKKFPHSNVLKSDEMIIAEVFRNYSNASGEKMKIETKWNTFIEGHEDLLENMMMCLFLDNGIILNSKVEVGYFQDKGKSWFSETLDNYQSDEELIDIEDLANALDLGQLVHIQDLEGLTENQLSILCCEHPEAMAEIIKVGFTGFDWEYDETEECSGCSEEFIIEVMLEVIVDGETEYICNTCVEKARNGRSLGVTA